MEWGIPYRVCISAGLIVDIKAYLDVYGGEQFKTYI
jgi:hypothetical protein